jgi:hypothetical protein
MEIRKIWITYALNGYRNLPPVGQASVIERQRINKKPENPLPLNVPLE